LGFQAYLTMDAMGIDKQTLAYGVAKRAETKRGERAAKAFINSRGIPQQTRRPKERYNKANRKGVYNITDL